MASTAKGDVRSIAERSCQPLACQIQECLAKHGYQQTKCSPTIAQWQRCVDKAEKKLLSDKKEKKRTIPYSKILLCAR